MTAVAEELSAAYGLELEFVGVRDSFDFDTSLSELVMESERFLARAFASEEHERWWYLLSELFRKLLLIDELAEYVCWPLLSEAARPPDPMRHFLWARASGYEMAFQSEGAFALLRS
ncbi:MAG TPA: hypothetical protein RMH85_26055 [Polyangiaceae bacterium LLY-WYZ-15_(1-7)]|nr:hypothetical protein [Polyangiaceae bacterium LLY-WYZ-15_(1-7)]HJL01509.1 hypothetical protein [Polyangiaceae bacterium LLY-WYZ-15_(1-7)]HJL11966.1 hypothetical protein [Polyangiaceae bacterium LLY-WYZ-15_(1-7)]HJL26309.1 hypothetical protein [Polyangiaceae bacterium LLY-WYZ-15_(1-7)]HJL32905.1 hypothetical protein [Polyangiaceae bacterium LLY-WYZ-15_(1-7)]